ncbi:RNA polymerase sigma factor [Sphingomonas sp. PR090111-T3T-6A]|uniref:RNA polymerase sigma factor n=1 Tax=Sphingomonas sp. PR090111-T3T-6A TaxID=685778 RepID=UPI0012FCB020|nr:sigma-70 family RNA polymerase sigma factor [Sphingomonas sp. PR090111-T3T-6A]
MVDSGQLAGESLSDVFLRHRPALRAFLRGRCVQHGVDDLLQDIWVETQRTSGPVTPDPLSHLYRVAHRLVLEQERGASRRDRRTSRHLPEMERTLIVPRPVPPAPETLRTLGARAEHVFRRYRQDGASRLAIAEELGISPGVVEMELGRAYAALLLSRIRA